MARYIAAFLLAVGLIVLVIVLIVHGLTSGPTTEAPTAMNLDSYSGTDTKVQLTIDSPVAADATHHDIIITVGNDESTMQVTRGYSGEVERQQSYPMNTVAYATFLHALAHNGYTQGDNDPSLKDERGQCALGDRYIFEIIGGSGDTLQHYWYTSCGTGTFHGDAAAVRQLFRLQIPDYLKLTSNVQL